MQKTYCAWDKASVFQQSYHDAVSDFAKTEDFRSCFDDFDFEKSPAIQIKIWSASFKQKRCAPS